MRVTMLRKTLVLMIGLLLSMNAWAFATTWTVGQTGADFRTIQAAVDAAQSGDVIVVASGIYRESVVITTSRLEIIGAGAGQSIIENVDIPVSFVRLAGGRLEGFTLRYTGLDDKPALLIENASPLVVDNEITGAGLAGVEIHNGAAPTLLDNHIHENLGTGVLVYDGANVNLTGNKIERNGLGQVHHPGIEVRQSARAVVDFNQLLLNGGSGAFVHGNSDAEFLGNTIVGNGLHGIAIEDGATAQVSSNTIWWNTEVGVLLRRNATVSVAGNTIARNLLGLVLFKEASATAIEPTQSNNLFLFNARDTVGIGLSPLDVRLVNNALEHPQAAELLQTLALIGEVVEALKTLFTEEDQANFIALTQAAELIQANIFNQSSLLDEAETRYRMVIRLDLHSAVADEARAALDALGR